MLKLAEVANFIFGQVFRRSDHIRQPTTRTDARKPIVLDDDGLINDGFINHAALNAVYATDAALAAVDADLTTLEGEVAALDTALTALDAEVTTLDGALTTHMADTTVHGTTGDVVGTSDAQTLTNKTLDSTNISTLTEKNPPVDADSIVTTDSEASNFFKRLTFTNLKAFLKSYFDGIYSTKAVVVSARVTHSTTQSLTSGSSTVLNFNTETWDTDNLHDNVTNNTRLTAPVDGKYIVSFSVDMTLSNVGWRYVTLRKNATTTMAIQGLPATTGFHAFTITSVLQLTAGDYIEATVFQNSGAPLNTTRASDYSPIFSMTLLSS